MADEESQPNRVSTQGTESSGSNQKSQEKRSLITVISEYLDFCQKVLLLLASLLVLVGGLAVLSSLDEANMIIIGQFVVAESVSKAGYTDLAISRRITDRLHSIVRQTTTVKEHKSIFVDKERPKIQIKPENISLQAVIQFLQSQHARYRTVVTGEAIPISTQEIKLIVRVEGKPEIATLQTIDEIDKSIDEVTQYVMKYAEPYILAAYFYVNGEKKKALEQIQYCIVQPPLQDDHWAYNLWGIYHLEEDDSSTAIQHFRRATELEPKFSVGFMNWGLALEGLGSSLEEAIQKYEKAVMISPSALALYLLGRAYNKQESYSKAIATLKKASKQMPRDPDILTELGVAYFHVSNYELALDKLQLAYDAGAKTVRTLYYLGKTFEDLGFGERAVKAYSEVLQLDPTFALAKKRLAFLNMRQQDSK